MIPARAKSKGIKNKNIINFSNNKSLTEIAVRFSQKLKFCDDIIVSTDSKEIKKSIEKKTNIKIPFLRSKKNSKDKSPIISVIEEVLEKSFIKHHSTYKTLILIEPTCPLRRLIDVKNAYKKYINGNYDSLWTVNKVDLSFHPDKQLKINKDKYLEFFNKKGFKITRRQMLDQTYKRNGVCYILNVKKFLKTKSLKMKKTGYFLCEYNMISIDTKLEFELAKKKYNKRLNNKKLF